MKPERSYIVLIILLYTLLGPQAEGIQLKLAPKDIQEAIRIGSTKKDLSHPELLKAWRIDLGYGVGSATLVTPYAGLIILAKESAMNYFREPTELEIQKDLEEKGKEICFGCGLYGEDIDFAPKWKATLEYKEEKREPVCVSQPASATYTKTYPASPKFWALCFFHFPMKGIGAEDKVTLILTDPKGKELRFPFDLSQLR